jgi:hypothetical protein
MGASDVRAHVTDLLTTKVKLFSLILMADACDSVANIWLSRPQRRFRPAEELLASAVVLLLYRASGEAVGIGTGLGRLLGIHRGDFFLHRLVSVFERGYARDGTPRNILSSIYGELKDYDKAVAEARETMRLDPANVGSYSNLSCAYRNLNRLALIIHDFAGEKRKGALKD